ncbi:MAG: cysteine hydrolase family protein [Desulfosarcinaceae bacterium]|nr:cysteine hydrolase family protein [Desulfosarcinaceae bacterium]
MTSSALLIIDVQRRFFDSDPKAFEAEAVIARINALARRARSAGAPVIFVQHEQASEGLLPNSDGWRLASGLEVIAHDIRVGKTTPDAFLGTELEMILQSRGVDYLVICGYASEYCVDTTVRRAAALGYPVQLVADAHTTDDKAHASAKQIRTHHNATLPGMRSFGPRIEAVQSAALTFSE